MVERLSCWATILRMAGAVALLSVGCGPYEEAEYPQGTRYEAPAPPTAAELVAAHQDRERAAADSREIVIGADGDAYSDAEPSALTEFNPALEGHGTWVDDSTYGTVWVPSSAEVGTDFQPYVTAGHWTYSEATDYVWVSDYAWGWVPFHYGRWVYLPNHGWSWIPGRRYAGAWVTWRIGATGDGYVGWAPMTPTWYWSHGSAIGWAFGSYRPLEHYVYCPYERLYHGAVGTHVVRGPAARAYDGRTQDYRPASPTVGRGDRVVANPGVSERARVIATPSVGSGRVAAPPAAVRGPLPDELGWSRERVVAPPVGHPGLSLAQAYASPRTAYAAGAAAPVHLTNPGVPEPRVVLQPSPPVAGAGGALGPSPGVSAVAPSFRSSPVVTPSFRSPSSPGVSAVAPSFRSSPVVTPSFRSPSSTGGASRSFRSSPAVSPSFRSSPSIRSSPSVSSGSVRSPSPAVRSFRRR